MIPLDPDLVARLYRQADAGRWQVSHAAFSDALARSAAKAFPAATPSPADIERHASGLHLDDLALACACAAGDEAAWEHFVREFRPALYRAASAIDPAGGRELADSLYGELFGLKEAEGERQSLFRYFHGRSSLGTWLRSILSQRHVDGLRRTRRLDPLPAEDGLDVIAGPSAVPAADPDRRRFGAALLAALAFVIQALAPRDRLRLGWYHAQQMTLAQIGRMTGEHEATISRHLARTRRAIREGVAQRLREHDGFSDREVEECFAAALDTGGTLDLATVFRDEGDVGKVSAVGRSKGEGMP